MKDSKKAILFGWIEACLRYGGTFGSAEKIMYQETFGLSEASVSRHQAEFSEIYERELGDVFIRDNNRRLIGGRLELEGAADLPEQPIFPKMPILRHWLQDNLGGAGYFEEGIRRREPELWIIQLVVKAIRSKAPIRITYHSRTGDSDRIVSPHSIVRIVGRMHVRAFSHARNDFRDFVFSRITYVAKVDGGLEYVGAALDTAWTQTSVLKMQYRENDTAEPIKRGIQLDFGLDKDGGRTFKVKKALVQYMVDDMDAGYASPVKILKNV